MSVKMISSADISTDGLYRYELTRVWGVDDRRLIIIGLNPSTADGKVDDPTIRRCASFAQREGCTGLVMLNLFAYRATRPTDLIERAVDPIGPRNREVLAKHADALAGPAVAAWGSNPILRHWKDWVRWVQGRFPLLYCFGQTVTKHPRHPLYLRRDAALEHYEGL